MGLKVYVSGMSGNKEVKKRQQRVFMILDSKNIKYDIIDITEPGKEGEKEMMQTKSTSNGATVSDPEPRHPLPPQIFNESEYCGDYDAFDLANEIDTLEQFLKLAPADTTAVSTAKIELKQENGDTVAEKIVEHEGENKENEEKDGDIVEKAHDESETVIESETVKQENDTAAVEPEAEGEALKSEGSEVVEKMREDTTNDHEKREEKGDRTQEETNLEENKQTIADKEKQTGQTTAGEAAQIDKTVENCKSDDSKELKSNQFENVSTEKNDEDHKLKQQNGGAMVETIPEENVENKQATENDLTKNNEDVHKEKSAGDEEDNKRPEAKFANNSQSSEKISSVDNVTEEATSTKLEQSKTVEESHKLDQFEEVEGSHNLQQSQEVKGPHKPDQSQEVEGGPKLDQSQEVEGSNKLDQTQNVEGSHKLDQPQEVEGSRKLGEPKLDQSHEVEGSNKLDQTQKVEGSHKLDQPQEVEGSQKLNQLQDIEGLQKLVQSLEELENSHKLNQPQSIEGLQKLVQSQKEVEGSHKLDQPQEVEGSHKVDQPQDIEGLQKLVQSQEVEDGSHKIEETKPISRQESIVVATEFAENKPKSEEDFSKLMTTSEVQGNEVVEKGITKSIMPAVNKGHEESKESQENA